MVPGHRRSKSSNVVGQNLQHNFQGPMQNKNMCSMFKNNNNNNTNFKIMTQSTQQCLGFWKYDSN